MEQGTQLQQRYAAYTQALQGPGRSGAGLLSVQWGLTCRQCNGGAEGKVGAHAGEYAEAGHARAKANVSFQRACKSKGQRVVPEVMQGQRPKLNS